MDTARQKLWHFGQMSTHWTKLVDCGFNCEGKKKNKIIYHKQNVDNMSKTESRRWSLISYFIYLVGLSNGSAPSNLQVYCLTFKDLDFEFI